MRHVNLNVSKMWIFMMSDVAVICLIHLINAADAYKIYATIRLTDAFLADANSEPRRLVSIWLSLVRWSEGVKASV